jgi:surfeit locus 1 family protein
MKLKLLFGGRRWISTLLVLLAMAVMIRLGFWQINRLHQRQARNAETARLIALPPLDLERESLPADPEVRYRRATVSGTFDLSQQVALKIQNFGAAAGIHLVAPLVLDNGQAVLVDRGWIPDELSDPAEWAQFDVAGTVTVTGYLRPSETLRPRSGAATATPLPGGQAAWYRVDVGAIQRQMPYELLPVYVLQSPGPEGNVELPYRTDPEFDLSDGSHLGFAWQWWIFALVAGWGYVAYISRLARKKNGTS